MDFIINQIINICNETDNDWFLSHLFTKIALNDIKLREDPEFKHIESFNDLNCTCATDRINECIKCNISLERHFIIQDELNIVGVGGGFNFFKYYDENNSGDGYLHYYMSKWIIADEIHGKIPGFILMKDTSEEQVDDFDYYIQFACVRKEYRRMGILKKMLDKIPKGLKIKLEASSTEIANIGKLWERCGFTHLKTMKYPHDVEYIFYEKHT